MVIYVNIKNGNIKIVFILVLMSLIVCFPNVSGKGVTQGLLISANVIIPSLFPFMVCVLMLIKTKINLHFVFLNKILYICFGQHFNMFFVFVLSMIGGYPIGSVLLDEMQKNNEISNKAANIMLTYCVNAGPAFVLCVVGSALGSYKLGIVLFVSNILSSLFLSIICAKELRKEENVCIKHIKNTKTFLQSFFESISDASSSIIRISCYIIFFSVINSYIDYFSVNIPLLKNIKYLTEITFAVTDCKNIYLVAFLLSFAGISIWCQVISMFKSGKINIKRFVFSRFLHGIISVTIVFLLLKIFDITLSTFSNGIRYNIKFLYSNFSLFCSMIVMIITFLIFVFSKNNSGNILDDVL